MIKIYNTLTRQLEEFKTIEPDVVKWYNCGPTVNGLMHLGHARSAIAFDTIRRYLEYRGYKVDYVMNFTDIEDRMIEVSIKEQRGVLELAEEYLSYFRRDMANLNLKPATVHPRAMLHINPIIEFVQKLEEKGYAYESGGDVYFDVRKFEEYGKLSNQKIENILQEGTEDSKNPNKKFPADFALWKLKKPGEPYWPSPWGEGRPGWHSECVLMSGLYLGEVIDIHSGGQDLIFPHHENEIAQAEALQGKPFVNYWLHNGFINIDKEKMSKSLGNYVNIVELLEYYSVDAVRLFILQTHYRSPITFTEDSIDQAQITSDRLFDVILLTKNYARDLEIDEGSISDLDNSLLDKITKAREDFINAMDEDFNTSNGFAVVFDYSREVNDYLRKAEQIKGAVIKKADELFDEFRTVLGLYEDFNSYLSMELVEKLVKLLVEIRVEYRKEKNWEMSDKIRDDLKEAGVTLEDNPKRILWKLGEN